MMNRKALIALVIATSLGSNGATRVQAAELNKSTPGASSSMRVTAVSADGSVIVGNYHDASHHWDVYRWTQAGGAQDLGISHAQANGVSADGSVVVGSIGDVHWNEHAFRWTQAGGVRDLGTSWSWTRATRVSADGSVIVGYFRDAHNVSHLFRWTEAGGAQDLGMTRAWVTGVSADGSMMVGYFQDANNASHVFRWTQSGGAQDLGIVGGSSTSVSAVSADGSATAGEFADVPGDPHVYRWTQSGGAVDLGSMGGKWAQVTGLSADGSVIVGEFADAQGVHHAYRWTQSGGAVSVGTMGWKWTQVAGVSADGSVIVGDFTDANGVHHAYRWTQSGGAQDLGNVTALSRLIYSAWTVPIIVLSLISALIAYSIIVVVGRRRRAARVGGGKVDEHATDHILRSRVYLYASAALISVVIFLVRAATLPAANAAKLRAIDACSLLSQDEMSAAVGAPMDSGKHFSIPKNLPGFKNSPEAKNECTWIQIPGPSRFQATLTLWIMPATDYDKRKAWTENITNVEGLGDDAYYDNNITVPILKVKEGGLYIEVSERSASDRQTIMDAERTIAARVLLRTNRSTLSNEGVPVSSANTPDTRDHLRVGGQRVLASHQSKSNT
jgi:probable HAF family extracellular repeat protein